jgi:hypothetical protein
MTNRAKIVLLSSGLVTAGLLLGAMFWLFGGRGATSDPQREHLPPDGTPEVADTIDLPEDEAEGENNEGTVTPDNGPNVPEEGEGVRMAPDPMENQPPPSPVPPIINPNPSGEGEKEFERIPPTRPALDLRQELERVHKDVGATARLPLSLFH